MGTQVPDDDHAPRSRDRARPAAAERRRRFSLLIAADQFLPSRTSFPCSANALKSCMCCCDCLWKALGIRSPTSRPHQQAAEPVFALAFPERRLRIGFGQPIARDAPHARADDLAVEVNDALFRDPVQVCRIPACDRFGAFDLPRKVSVEVFAQGGGTRRDQVPTMRYGAAAPMWLKAVGRGEASVSGRNFSWWPLSFVSVTD